MVAEAETAAGVDDDSNKDNNNNRNTLQGNRLVQKFKRSSYPSERLAESSSPSRTSLGSRASSSSKSVEQDKDKKQQQSQQAHSLLICYATAGYPDIQTTKEIVSTMINAGADIIEIGIPFSDPLADGPVIQQASFAALSKGITFEKSLEIVKDIRNQFSEIPIVLMTYTNILVKAGFDKFLRAAKGSGADGIILPDMSIEESDEYVKEATKYGLATIFLVSPNTKEDRLRKIASKSTGFLYLVSTYGTTGMRDSFDTSFISSYIKNVKRIVGEEKEKKIMEEKEKALSSSSSPLPLAIGFGISKPEHAKFMADSGADAVITASAIINIIMNHNRLLLEAEKKNNNYDKIKKDMLNEVTNFVTAMKSAMI